MSSESVEARGAGTKPPRVLLLAEAANPEMVSVPLVGYAHARAIAEIVDAHIVTQVRNKQALIRAGLRPGRDFTALDTEWVAAPMNRATDVIRRRTGLGWTFTTAMQTLPYYAFERAVWRRFGPQIERGEFDVVHRLTPLSPTIPSVIGRRCADLGVPFVWGPINGGIPWPAGFADVQRREGEWLHHVRDVHRLLPGFRATRDHAAALIIASMATMEQLTPSWREKAVYIPENAVDPDQFDPPSARSYERPLRLGFVGRLVAYKGLDMVLDAAAELLRGGAATLDVMGDGPERAALEEQISRLGVADAVTMHGFVPHAELAPRLRGTDVLSFPSLREFGGAVVLEAMALGVVPVVVDYGGPAELVTDATGYRIDVGSREEIVAELRRILEGLADDPSVLRARSERGRTRVEQRFTWRAKAEMTRAVYRWVLGQDEKPGWGMPFDDHEH